MDRGAAQIASEPVPHQVESPQLAIDPAELEVSGRLPARLLPDRLEAAHGLRVAALVLQELDERHPQFQAASGRRGPTQQGFGALCEPRALISLGGSQQQGGRPQQQGMRDPIPAAVWTPRTQGDQDLAQVGIRRLESPGIEAGLGASQEGIGVVWDKSQRLLEKNQGLPAQPTTPITLTHPEQQRSRGRALAAAQTTRSRNPQGLVQLRIRGLGSAGIETELSVGQEHAGIVRSQSQRSQEPRLSQAPSAALPRGHRLIQPFLESIRLSADDEAPGLCRLVSFQGQIEQTTGGSGSRGERESLA